MGCNRKYIGCNKSQKEVSIRISPEFRGLWVTQYFINIRYLIVYVRNNYYLLPFSLQTKLGAVAKNITPGFRQLCLNPC